MHELPAGKEAATQKDLGSWVRLRLENIVRIDTQGPSDLRRLLIDRQNNTIIGMPSQGKDTGRRKA